MTRRTFNLLLFGCCAAFAASCPQPPAITPQTAGPTVWGYVVSNSSSGTSYATQAAMTYAGAPALNSTNYNLVDWSGSGLPIASNTVYSIYRVIAGAGGNPTSTGLIGSVTASDCSSTHCQFKDTGQGGDGTQPPFNPSLATYKTNLQALIATMRAQTAGQPQPRPLLSAQHVLAMGGDLTAGFPACTPNYGQGGTISNPCSLANVTLLNQYTDALVRAGVQSIDINFDPIVLESSAQYSGTLSGDCASPYTPGLPINTLPPAGSGKYCQLLSVSDQMFAYAQSRGLLVRLAPVLSNFATGQCGLSSGSTEVNVESCMKPLYQAVAARWPTLNTITVIHEPVGAWYPPATLGAGAPLWSTTDTQNFIMHTGAAIKSQSPAISICASIGTGLRNGESAAHWYAWAANLVGNVDCLAIDLYSNSYDPSAQMAPGSYQNAGVVCSPSATSNSCNWTGGAYTFAQDLVAQAKAAGIPVRVNESNRPVWVPNACAPTGANGIWDNGYPEWMNDGLDVAWQDAFVPWAAAQGFVSVSQFASWPFVHYDPENYTTILGYAQSALLPFIMNTAPAGKAWSTAAAHLTGLQGTAHLSGAVRLSH